MQIAIIGASGAIGSVLTRLLLDTTDYTLVLFSHHAQDLKFSDEDEKRLNHSNGSVLNKNDIQQALKDCDAAVYLVHLMGDRSRKGNFMNADAEAADNFAKAASANHVQKVVYVGGMGRTDQPQTQHLAAREQTGQILRNHMSQVIEFKVPLVVGPRAAGFETLRSLVRRLPILPIPSWANAEAQPIAIQDVARYVKAGLTVKTDKHLTVEIGGPEVMTYQVLAERYARTINKKLYVVHVPFVPKRLAIWAINILVPRATSAIVADMIGSAAIPMTTDTTLARKLFPEVKVSPVEDGFIN